jgi:hypothetical protein
LPSDSLQGFNAFALDITGLYLDKFSLLPAGRRIFIQTVQQINGWRNLPPKHFRPHPHPVGRAPAKASTNPPVSSPPIGCARPGRDIFPSIPLVITFYYNRMGIRGV